MNTLRKLIALLLFILSSTTAFAITDAQVFAFAEANYPSLFTGTATAGTFPPYNYRYYPATGNYLAVDTAGEVFILGPYTGNVITSVGLATTYASAITAWEAVQAATQATGFAGNYSGTFSGGDTGTWSITILSNGSLTGIGYSNNLRGAFTGVGQVTSNGSLSMTTGAASTGATFSGSISPTTRVLSGTWSNVYYRINGTFSGQ